MLAPTRHDRPIPLALLVLLTAIAAEDSGVNLSADSTDQAYVVTGTQFLVVGP